MLKSWDVGKHIDYSSHPCHHAVLFGVYSRLSCVFVEQIHQKKKRYKKAEFKLEEVICEQNEIRKPLCFFIKHLAKRKLKVK